MAISKKPLHQDAATLLPGTPVTVEHEIGRLSPDPDGEPTLIAGFRMVAEYENDARDIGPGSSRGDRMVAQSGGKYRIPLPDGGIAVLDVHYEQGEDR